MSQANAIRRVAETLLRDARDLSPNAKLDAGDKILASAVGGTLGCWNHPVKVLRIEMQSLKPGVKGRPDKLTMASTAKYIYQGKLRLSRRQLVAAHELTLSVAAVQRAG